MTKAEKKLKDSFSDDEVFRLFAHAMVRDVERIEEFVRIQTRTVKWHWADKKSLEMLHAAGRIGGLIRGTLGRAGGVPMPRDPKKRYWRR
jgi:hypothetical protein